MCLCGYKNIWATVYCVEASASITGKVSNKPGVNKDSQTIIFSAIYRIRHGFYIHCHNFYGKPTCWKNMGYI